MTKRQWKHKPSGEIAEQNPYAPEMVRLIESPSFSQFPLKLIEQGNDWEEIIETQNFILKTHDEHHVYDENTVISVVWRNDWDLTEENAERLRGEISPDALPFLYRENAEIFIRENKPIYSEKDKQEFIDQLQRYCLKQAEVYSACKQPYHDVSSKLEELRNKKSQSLEGDVKDFQDQLDSILDPNFLNRMDIEGRFHSLKEAWFLLTRINNEDLKEKRAIEIQEKFADVLRTAEIEASSIFQEWHESAQYWKQYSIKDTLFSILG